jgi:glycerophosphoryl diester phosphodiesterase
VILECDVQTLKDGTLTLMHDSTVDRTTNGTGAIAALTQQQLGALGVDGNAWQGSNFGNQAVPLFAEWVDRYKSKAILMPEDKDFVSMASMLRVLDAAGADKQRVLIQCFNLDSLKLAAAAGYECCFVQMGLLPPSLLTDTGIRWVGISSIATDEQFRAWVASGVSVVTFTLDRRYERDAKLALGVKGFFSDDPVYLSAEQPLATQDNFANQTWAPGMLGSVLDIEGTSHGKFFANDYWGYDFSSAGYVGCLQGYLCPVKGKAETRSFALSLNIKFDAVTNKDQTKWASVFIGVDDRPFTDSNELTTGFNFLFRKDGSMEIHKKQRGATAVRLATIAGGKIADGEEISIRLTLSDTTVAAARLSDTGTEVTRVSLEDHSPKGGYIQLGRNGLACKFRKLSVI